MGPPGSSREDPFYLLYASSVASLGGEHPLQARLDPFPPCLEEHVESRDQEDAEHRGRAHSEEHRGAYVQAASCASSGCEEHGQDAADARYRRHHDRTETFRPRLGGGIEDRQAAHVVLFHGELDDEDRILRRKPYQKEDPELGVDADGDIHDHDPDQSPQEGDRKGQNDAEGVT